MDKFNFNFDYNGETKQVNKHWQFCVGSGHAALAKRADYMEQLKRVHDELGMERVRFHGVFDDDMNVVVRPRDFVFAGLRNKTKIYSFYQIGKIYDNILKIGMKPFVELGFMPSALASGRKTIFFYKGNVTQPKSMSEWQGFIKAFIKYLIDRYGKEEVETWYFEVWNEPDLPSFFKGTMEDYYRLYKATVEAVREVDPDIIIGGPANTPLTDPADFLKFCLDNNVHFDYISTHRYTSDALGHAMDKEKKEKIKKINAADPLTSLTSLLQPIFDTKSNFTNENKGYLTNEMQKVRDKIGDIPLFYTEWGVSSNCTAHIHDTVKNSSFLVKTVLDSQGVIDGSSYWTFSDIFEELFFFPEPFCGGFGLMTVDGIPKPAFWAFKLLAQIPDTRYKLPITNDDVEYAAFKGDNGSLYLMVYAQNFNDEEKSFDVSFNIENAPNFANAQITRVNKEHGNPFDLWVEMGEPSSLTREEVAEIKEKTLVKSENLNIEVKDGKAFINTVISNNEIALVEIQQ